VVPNGKCTIILAHRRLKRKHTNLYIQNFITGLSTYRDFLASSNYLADAPSPREGRLVSFRRVNSSRRLNVCGIINPDAHGIGLFFIEVDSKCVERYENRVGAKRHMPSVDVMRLRAKS
jgi:hypothetical protein